MIENENSLIPKRPGIPRDLFLEIYNTTYPVFRKYRLMKKGHLNKFRIFGLASMAIKEAWVASKD